MKERFVLKDIQPEAHKAMHALEKYLSTADIDPLHKELIKIRASQINGCAFCISLHTKDAQSLGESPERIYLLNAWREAPHFSDEERIILAMTEEITLISQRGLTNETYTKAVAAFGLQKTAQLIMAITVINAWNRIGISSHRIAPLT